MKKCFVVMGFGEKMDYITGNTVDLDIVYNDVIKPLMEKEFSEYEVIRGDDITSSGEIDLSMYKLLLDADLVIADITTHNDNALYELGVRYALRQASTIVTAQREEDGNNHIPFDLSHIRIFFYDKLDTPNGELHRKQLSETLKLAIRSSEDRHVDSPVYTYLRELQPPTKSEGSNITDEEIDKIQQIAEMASSGQKSMSDSDFDKAISYWKSLHDILPNNPYFIQQWALATYKLKKPSEKEALEAAWKIINILPVSKTLDTETLGIAGAICKNLSQLKRNSLKENKEYLDQAIGFYRNGYLLKHDYYTGENYANCILLKLQNSRLDEDDWSGLNYIRRQVCRELVKQLSNKEVEDKILDKWEVATLSNCYLHLGDRTNAAKYEKKFLESGPVKWEQETFKNTKDLIIQVVFDKQNKNK